MLPKAPLPNWLLPTSRGEQLPRRLGTFEVSLATIIRRVLRGGRGRPRLVQWVQQLVSEQAEQRDRGHRKGLEWMAAVLARQLCAELLQQRGAGLRTGPDIHDTLAD